MEKPVLLVLAAGMGSRYGGLKQIDPVGSHGQSILDYSVYDARRAGFETVVFLIKDEIEADFRRTVGDRVSRGMEVRYAFQRVEDLPAGCAAPADRVRLELSTGVSPCIMLPTEGEENFLYMVLPVRLKAGE